MSIIADTGIGENLTAIASGLLGIALIALILYRSDSAAQLVGTASSSFNSLLQTVTLQNGSVARFR
jgi:hypothetical protein